MKKERIRNFAYNKYILPSLRETNARKYSFNVKIVLDWLGGKGVAPPDLRWFPENTTQIGHGMRAELIKCEQIYTEIKYSSM